MLASVISKYLDWQRRVCEAVGAAVEKVVDPTAASDGVAASPETVVSESSRQDKPSEELAIKPVVSEPEVIEAVSKPSTVEAPAGECAAVVESVVANEVVDSAATKSVESEVAPVASEVAESEVVSSPEVVTEVAVAIEPAVSERERLEVVVPESPAEPKMVGSWSVPEGVRESESDVLFQDFPLDIRILRAVLDDLQFTKCTPIQALTMPHALAGDDIAGKAQTGTGKTATFLIAMLQKFLKETGSERQGNQPFALVLAPTRELAIQIAHDANALCAYCHFKTVPVYGGMDYDRQRRLLTSGVDMVVATPGRLIDYLQQGVVNLDQIKVLIIDEADRMLDMGFIPDVKRIVGRLKGPDSRQTLLFSATLNSDIMNLASRWMRPNPVKLEVEPEHIVAEGIEETVYAVTAAEKLPVLLWTLRHEECHRVLIFRNRRSEVEELHADLQRYGVASEMLSGDVDQKKRLRILEDFKAGRVTVIVATDVAGRGIHVDDVTHVINYDFPYEAEDYVHRVGRTARAGHKGRAISFADENSSFVVPDIEQYIARPLPITYPEDDMLVLPEAVSGGKAPVEKSRASSPRGGNFNRGGRSRRSGGFRR